MCRRFQSPASTSLSETWRDAARSRTPQPTGPPVAGRPLSALGYSWPGLLHPPPVFLQVHPPAAVNDFLINLAARAAMDLGCARCGSSAADGSLRPRPSADCRGNSATRHSPSLMRSPFLCGLHPQRKPPACHVEARSLRITGAAFSRAISLSVALKRPVRSFGAMTDSRASSFTVGSVRV